MNGPPTPPPTTLIELQDEARATSLQNGSSNQSSDIILSSQQTSAQIRLQDTYQQKFPSIATLAMAGDLQELIRSAENFDINASDDMHVTRLLIIAPLTLAYLILDDIPSARYVLARLPDNLKSRPLSSALYSLTTFTADREYAKIYSQAELVYNLVAQPDFFDQDLSVIVRSMVTSFVESFRRRMFILLSKAYSSLPITLACLYLGMNAEQVVTVASQDLWKYDPSSQNLTPNGVTRSQGSANAPSVSAISSLQTFHFVANSVALLET